MTFWRLWMKRHPECFNPGLPEGGFIHGGGRIGWEKTQRKGAAEQGGMGFRF
jgi:hypothetical protein